MATKTAPVAQPEASDTREEGPDAPLLDTLGAELKKRSAGGDGSVPHGDMQRRVSLRYLPLVHVETGGGEGFDDGWQARFDCSVLRGATGVRALKNK